MVSATLGSKKKVRKMPVTTSTTNEYRAISPNMNDQWSGKTFASADSAKEEAADPVVDPAGQSR